MNAMELFNTIKKLADEEEGADATEYALLAALIAVVMIVSARAVGTKVNGVFNQIQSNLP
jgi:pilus assembly protein Flp/PilA